MARSPGSESIMSSPTRCGVIDSLSKRYGYFAALDGLSLDIRRGLIFGLLGPNGVGKGTAIKILTTLLDASAGSARVAGFDVAKQPVEVRRAASAMPQLLSADGALTARREPRPVDPALRPARQPARRSDRAGAALRRAGGRVRPSGQDLLRRHGAAARDRTQATLHEPGSCSSTEPTMGLDPAAPARSGTGSDNCEATRA